MLSTLKNAWKIPDLKKRILFTLFLVCVYRFGSAIPVAGIDPVALANKTRSSGGILGFYDLLSGGAFSKSSIFAMGVVPYINASIILQLLTVAIPFLEQLSKEGEDGRKKIQKITRYSAVVLAAVQSYGAYVIIHNFGAIKNDGPMTVFLIMLILTASSVFLMWLGDQITTRGIGNGMSLIIFVNIVSRLPVTFKQVYSLQSTGTVDIISTIALAIFAVLLVVSVILMSLAERRINVQYAGKIVGNKSYKGQSTHIPLNLIASGVIAIIFTMSVMMTPKTIGQFMPDSWFATTFVNGRYSPFYEKSIQYLVVYAVMVIFFSWFYTQITFKPDEMAENMHKSSGFIPGIRPGQNTATYIERVLTKVSIIGGSYAALIAILPIAIANYTSFESISFGGTSVLIMVGVALDTMRTLESQLVMRHYQGFLK